MSNTQYLYAPAGVLYHARIRMGLTQKNAAAKVGVHPMSWWKWENGIQQPRGVNAKLLFDFLQRNGCLDLARTCVMVTRDKKHK